MTVANIAPLLLLALLFSSAALSAQAGKVLKPGDPGLQQPQPTAPDYNLPAPLLPMKLSAQNVNNKAVGTATITNPLKETIEIPEIYFDIRFRDVATDSHKDDIMQQFALRDCGSFKLPATIAPGGKLECKFESRQNIYKGKIDIVATVTEAGFKPSEGTHNIAFDTITLDAANTKAGRRLHSSGSGARRLLQQGGDTSMPAKPGNIVRLKAPALGASDFPLDLKLSVKREGLTAAGTATITNTLNNIVEIPKVYFDVRFTDATTMAYKDDIRQQGVLTTCGFTKLPTTLAPGSKLECPFKSRENIYKGSITVVSYVDEKANSPEEETIGAHVAYDVVKCPMKDGAECTKG